MSSEIWQIGQNMKAQDAYETSRRSFFVKTSNTELFAVYKLTATCKEMNEDLTKDQNRYEDELSDIEYDYNSFKKEVNDEISKLKQEINELLKKVSDGTITEAERQELKEKQKRYRSLSDNLEEKGDSASSEVKSKKSAISQEFSSKIEIALDYGTLTVEKGQPLAETDLSKGMPGFWSKNIAKKAIGMEAVAAGNELLDNVKEISSKNKELKGK